MPYDRATLTADYARDGYVFPIRAFSEAQATGYRARLEQAEEIAKGIEDGTSLFREYSNIALDFVGEIMTSPAVTGFRPRLEFMMAFSMVGTICFSHGWTTRERASPTETLSQKTFL